MTTAELAPSHTHRRASLWGSTDRRRHSGGAQPSNAQHEAFGTAQSKKLHQLWFCCSTLGSLNQ